MPTMVLHNFFKWLRELGLVGESIIGEGKETKPEAALPRTEMLSAFS